LRKIKKHVFYRKKGVLGVKKGENRIFEVENGRKMGILGLKMIKND
jgi:hypothetical protein